MVEGSNIAACNIYERPVQVLPRKLSLLLAQKRALLILGLGFLLISSPQTAKANSSTRLYAREGHGLVEIQADRGTIDWGLQVVIDGLIFGFTPWRGQIPIGEHSLVLRRVGMAERQHNIYVTDDEKISLDLSARPCTIKYSSQYHITYPSICVGDNEDTDPAVRKFYTSMLSGFSGNPGKRKVIIDLGFGYPNIARHRIYVGFLGSQPDAGMSLAAEFRTVAYQNDVLLGVRMGGRFGPFMGSSDILIGGGGGPRGRREFLPLHFSFSLGFYIGSRFSIGMGIYFEVANHQACPSLAELESLAIRRDLQTIAELAQPETPRDICTSLRGQNPIADAVGYDPIHHKLSEELRAYDPNNALYANKIKDIQSHLFPDVLSRISLARWEATVNFEYAINHRWNVWLRPMFSLMKNFTYSPEHNPIIPPSGMVLYENSEFRIIPHGQIGVTLKI